MRREEEEIGGQISRPVLIGNPGITGMFTHVSVPTSLAIGSDLIIKVEFYAKNTEGSLIKPWNTFLIADIPALGRYELDAAHRFSQEVSTGIKTYKLGKIPEISSPTISLVLRLFAHWDANYSWNWAEYQAWLEGYSASFTLLDSSFNFISITEKPPEVKYERLEIDITPAGGGYVRTSPTSEEGRSTWHNGDTGTFAYGTQVRVTAYPNSGYEFDKWSDEIEGGVSYINPAYVKLMTEQRTAKCHFKSVTVPPGEEPEEPVPPEEGEGKFPIGTLLLIGGGAAALVVAVAASKGMKKRSST